MQTSTTVGVTEFSAETYSSRSQDFQAFRTSFGFKDLKTPCRAMAQGCCETMPSEKAVCIGGD